MADEEGDAHRQFSRDASDTSMIYPGLKNDAERADLIAYLETLHQQQERQIDPHLHVKKSEAGEEAVSTHPRWSKGANAISC